MANFGSPDFSGLNQPLHGQMFGPRHSSPNIVGANSPVPPNIGPIPNIPPPGVVGPHMQLFNPMGVAQFPARAPSVTSLPWGAGVMPVAGQVPMTVPPPRPWIAAGPLQPKMQIPIANQISTLQQNDQSESRRSPLEDDRKHDHKHRHKHKHEHRHSHYDDKHKEKKHYKEKKRSPKRSHHHDEKRKSSRSRHGSDENLDLDDSDSSHVKERRYSSGSRHKERSERHSHGTVLIEDRDEERSDKHLHGAVLREDRNGQRSERGPYGAVLLEDCDEKRNERGSHGAVLLEDRDSEYEKERDVELRSNYDAEDGEIYDDELYESSYSEDGRKEWQRNKTYDRDRRDRLISGRDVRNRSRDKGRDERHYNNLGDRSVSDVDIRDSCKERRKDGRQDRDLVNRLVGDRNASKSSRERENDGRHNQYRESRLLEYKDNRNQQKNSKGEQYRDNRQDGGSRPRRERNNIDDYSKEDNVYRWSDQRNRDQFSKYNDFEDDDYNRRDSNLRDDRQSSIEEDLKHSANENFYGRNGPHSERSVRNRGHSGAILREDRGERIIFQKEKEQSRSGAVLIEDRVEFGDNLNDGRNIGHRSKFVDERRDSKGHALLLDDREEGRGHLTSQKERRVYREQHSHYLDKIGDKRDRHSDRGDFERDRIVNKDQHIDKERRNFDRNKRNDEREGLDNRDNERLLRGQGLSAKRGSHFEKDVEDYMRDRNERTGDDREKRKVPIDRNLDPEGILDTKRGRTGALLIEDRDNQNTDKRHEVSRTGAVLIEDRDKRHEVSRTGAVLIEDRDKRHEVSRTGAVLIEDRDKRHEVSRTGAVLIEDRDKRHEVSRTGAVLIEDRNEDRSFSRCQRSYNASFRGQGYKGLSRIDSRSNVTRHSQERSSNVQRSKRSRSSSLSKQEVRLKHDRCSGEREEPEQKRRRVWEPGPNDVSTTKCIRSGSPAVPGNDDEMDTEPIAAWVRCSAADLYFTKDPKTGNMITTKRMRDLEERFDHELVQRAAMVKALQEPYEREVPKPNWKNQCSGHTHHCGGSDHESECSSSSSSSSDSESDSEEWWMEEMKFKQQNPYRLHSEIWYNDPNELNYGPLCRCSNKAKKFGIRHSIYPGEEPLTQCNLNSNNLDKLYHYRITVSPAKNFIISQPTVIMFDGHEYLFEGFSIFSHKPIPKWPECQVIRFNIIYTIHVVEEQVPENFSVQSLDTFTEYLFDEILELVDIDWRGPGGESNCRRFHVMPRFARPFPENGKELLSMNDVLLYLLKFSKPLLEPSELLDMYELDNENWTKYVDSFRHMVVTCPGKRPSSIRIDQLDRTDCNKKDGELKMPFIIHHGVRPPQLSYAGDPIYKKKWREYMKFRHLLWSRARISAKEREKLYELEIELEKIRMKCTMKREITVAISSEGFLKTGIRADICQHAMLLPVLFEHLRFHECMSVLEKSIGYQFRDRSLLQLAMTHSSYKINYGTNPDHGRNSLSNCGFRQLEFGDHKVVTQHTRKRGLNVLLRIMAKMGHKEEKRSEIPHNERLEFLGDAVVEFVTSTHLYNMFPQASEGELTLYRGSLVNNSHLSVLADKLRLQDFLLYAHGPDLCHDSNLRHAMANCFEALMGSLFLDGGIERADRVFSKTCFPEEDLSDTWMNTPKHPLVADEPNGDRHWIAQSHVLQKQLFCNVLKSVLQSQCVAYQKLSTFEEDIGYEFKHIRLLARAFTQRNVGYNNLTYGHNQRLEFLGDTIMQLICSEYLFKHFPDHHEGHLTLLRSSLVNNKTQATVSTELGMPDFVIKANMTKVDEKPQNYSDLKTKEKADLLEALYGALYVDGGLEPCQILTDICFFPRLEDFILDQEWNDPKSQLQQCCLTLREMNDESPNIPIYKVIRKYGPTNQRKYTVAVYFREKRLAVGSAGSKQQAEMVAAETALQNSKGLFHKNVYPPPKSKSKQTMKEVKEEST